MMNQPGQKAVRTQTPRIDMLEVNLKTHKAVWVGASRGGVRRLHCLCLMAFILVAPRIVRAQSLSQPDSATPTNAHFTVGIEMPSQAPVTPAMEAALRDMGVQYLNYYVKPWAASPEEAAATANEAMLGLADKLGIEFALSCYVVDPPDSCVRQALESGNRFKGIVFDEVEHCRLLNPHKGAQRLADPTTFHSLEEAYAATLRGFQLLYDKYSAMHTPVTATHVFPVLLHVAARAGFTPCPKICKEMYSPVSFAIGMGAALQYGRDLTVDCDMWYYDLVPGHTAQEIRSNLLMAYWLGADMVYLEGSGHNLTPAGHQGTPFSLVNQVTDHIYQLTEHGEMLRWFIRDYLPAHPRPWTFRDVKPEIAIVRFPDSSYGQGYFEKNENGWHVGLYGSPNLTPNADTEAWFGIWNLLTCGRTGHDGITYFKKYIASTGYQRPPVEGVAFSLHTRPVQAASHHFFAPMNGVVVFDHLVGYERLKDIPLIFLAGVAVSDDTMKALRRCVSQGATLVIWGNLAKRIGFPEYSSGVKEIPEGKGRFILTDDFSRGQVWQDNWPHMVHPDEIRYRFGDHTVVLRRVTDDDVGVEIDGKPATQGKGS